MNYKGYVGEVTYDETIGIFAGKVTNAKAVGTFYGATADEIEREFKNTIDEYLLFSAEKGLEPEKPSSIDGQTVLTWLASWGTANESKPPI